MLKHFLFIAVFIFGGTSFAGYQSYEFGVVGVRSSWLGLTLPKSLYSCEFSTHHERDRRYGQRCLCD